MGGVSQVLLAYIFQKNGKKNSYEPFCLYWKQKERDKMWHEDNRDLDLITASAMSLF